MVEYALCPACGGADHGPDGGPCVTCGARKLVLAGRGCDVCAAAGYRVRAIRWIHRLRVRLCHVCVADMAAHPSSKHWAVQFSKAIERRAAALGFPREGGSLPALSKSEKEDRWREVLAAMIDDALQGRR